MKKAFTLAEVLITIGVIGIVAAMTLPALIQKNHKTIVETRLKKFYSEINQAILMAQKDYGDKELWDMQDTDYFWSTFLEPYMKYLKTEDFTYRGRIKKIVYLVNGSAFVFDIYNYAKETNEGEYEVQYNTDGGHFLFCPIGKYCTQEHFSGNIYGDAVGVRQFVFGFWPNDTSQVAAQYSYHKNKGVEPYLVGWDGEYETFFDKSLGRGCKDLATANNSTSSNEYCTAIIWYNGWKVPDDYPLRF